MFIGPQEFDELARIKLNELLAYLWGCTTSNALIHIAKNTNFVALNPLGPALKKRR